MKKVIPILLISCVIFSFNAKFKDIKDLICDDFTAEYDVSMTLKEKQNIYVREVLIPLNFISNTKTVKDSMILEIEKVCPTVAQYKQELIEKNPILLLNNDEYWRALYNMENKIPWKAGKKMKFKTYCQNRFKAKKFDPTELCDCINSRIEIHLSDKEFYSSMDEEQRRIVDRIKEDYCSK